MISPHTPPGTEVCCIDDSPGPYGPTGLSKGAYYTIKSIEIGLTSCGFVAILGEIQPLEVYDQRFGPVVAGFGLYRFRYLETPKKLMDLQYANTKQLEHVLR